MSDRTFCKRCVQSERQQQGMVQDPGARQAGPPLPSLGTLLLPSLGTEERERRASGVESATV